MVRCFLLNVFFFAFIVSCGQTDRAFDELSEDEKVALRARAEAKCLSSNAAAFEKFKSDSDENLFTTTSYKRDVSFKFSIKDGSSVTKREGTLQVWSQRSDFIIFYYDEAVPTTNKFFLRLTKAQNDLMIETLKQDFCKRSPSSLFTDTNIDDNGPASFNYIYRPTGTTGTTVSDFHDHYSFTFSEPALFGGLRLTRQEITHPRNTDTGEVDETTNHQQTKNWTPSFAAGGLPALNDNYLNTSLYVQKFCDFTSTHLINSSIEMGYQFPAGTCPDTPAGAGWDAHAMDVIE